MNDVLRIILSLSVSGTLLFLITLFGSFLLKEHFGKTWCYYVWLVVIIRFLLPITTDNSPVGALFQTIPSIEYKVPAVVEEVANPYTNTLNGVQKDKEALNVTVSQENAVVHTQTSTPDAFYQLGNYLVLLWISVGVLLLIRKIIRYLRFVSCMKVGNKEVSETELLNQLASVCVELGIKREIELYINPYVATPLIFGFMKPTIVLNTTNVCPSDFRYIILHELTHYRRGDIFYKWLVQVTICIHWFNPIVYWLAKEVNVACELSCDEAVIRRLDAASKKAYGNVLIESMKNPVLNKQSLAGITLSQNAKMMKTRLQAIMNYKKKRISIMIASYFLLVFLGIGGTLIGAASSDDKKTVSNTHSNNISLEGKSEAYKLIAKLYDVDTSLTVAEYENEILNLCQGDEGKLFNAISEAEIIDMNDPLYSFVMGSLSYTSSEFYADLKINLEEEPYVSGIAKRVIYKSQKEINKIRGEMSEEEWDLFLNEVNSSELIHLIDKSLYVSYSIDYHIFDKTAITIKERDAIFMSITSKMQKYIDELSEEELFADTINTSFEEKLKKVTSKYNSNIMSLQCEVHHIEKEAFDK